jgi:hypothetical protein
MQCQNYGDRYASSSKFLASLAIPDHFGAGSGKLQNIAKQIWGNCLYSIYSANYLII